MTVLADSRNAKIVERGRITLKGISRSFDPSELTIQGIEWLDDRNNMVSIWSDVQAADIVLAFISEELLDALDELTDMQSGNNLIAQELLAIRADKGRRLVPIVLADCTWNEDGSIFKGLVPLPRGRSLSAFASRDDAWMLIAGGIRAVIKDIRNPPTKTTTAPTANSTTVVAPSLCPKCDAVLAPNATICRACGTTFGQPQRVIPQQAPTFPPASSRNGVLVVSSRKDDYFAVECIKHMQNAGLNVIDANKIAPGNGRDRDLTEKVACTRVTVLLVSSDYLNESFNSNSIPAKIVKQLPRTKPIYAVIIRPCFYDGSLPDFSTEILSTDGKPIGSSRCAEESWMEVAKIVKQSI